MLAVARNESAAELSSCADVSEAKHQGLLQ